MARERAPVQIVGLSPKLILLEECNYMGCKLCHTQEDAQNAQEMVKLHVQLLKIKN